MALSDTLSESNADGAVQLWLTAPLLDPALEGVAAARKPLFAGTHHQGGVHALRWSSSGRWLASGGDDGVAIVWGQRPGGGMRTFGSAEPTSESWYPALLLQGHKFEVQDVAWSPDERFLATSSIDTRVLIWQLPLAPTAVAPNQAPGGAGATAASTSSRLLTTPFRELQAHDSWARGMSWDPLGRYLATFGDDRCLRVWGTGAESKPWTAKELDPHAGARAAAPAVSAAGAAPGQRITNVGASSAASRTFGAGGSVDRDAAEWNMVTEVDEPYRDAGSRAECVRIDWSPDGVCLSTSLALARGRFTAPVLSRCAWTVAQHLGGHRLAVTAARFAPFLLTSAQGSASGSSRSSSDAATQASAAAAPARPGDSASASVTTYPVLAVGSNDRGFSIWLPHLQTPVAVVAASLAAAVSDIAWGCVPWQSADGDAGTASSAAQGGFGGSSGRPVQGGRGTVFVLVASIDGSLTCVTFSGNDLGTLAPADAAIGHMAAVYDVPIADVEDAARGRGGGAGNARAERHRALVAGRKRRRDGRSQDRRRRKSSTSRPRHGSRRHRGRLSDDSASESSATESDDSEGDNSVERTAVRGGDIVRWYRHSWLHYGPPRRLHLGAAAARPAHVLPPPRALTDAAFAYSAATSAKAGTGMAASLPVNVLGGLRPAQNGVMVSLAGGAAAAAGASAVAPASSASETLARQQVTQRGGKRRIAPVLVNLDAVQFNTGGQADHEHSHAGPVPAPSRVTTVVTSTAPGPTAGAVLPGSPSPSSGAATPTQPQQQLGALKSPAFQDGHDQRGANGATAVGTPAFKPTFDALDAILSGLSSGARASASPSIPATHAATTADGAAGKQQLSPRLAAPQPASHAAAVAGSGGSSAVPKRVPSHTDANSASVTVAPDVHAADVRPVVWGIDAMREALAAVLTDDQERDSGAESGEKARARSRGRRRERARRDSHESGASESAASSSSSTRSRSRRWRSRGRGRRGSRVSVPSPAGGPGTDLLANVLQWPGGISGVGMHPALLGVLAVQSLASMLAMEQRGIHLAAGQGSAAAPFEAGAALDHPWQLMDASAHSPHRHLALISADTRPAVPPQNSAPVHASSTSALPAPPRLPRVTVVVLAAREAASPTRAGSGWSGHASAAAPSITDPFDVDAMQTDDVYVTAYAPPEPVSSGAQGDTGVAAACSSLFCVQGGTSRWPSRVLSPGRVSIMLAAPQPACSALGLPVMVAVGGFDGSVRMLDAETGRWLSPSLLVGSGAVAHVAVRFDQPVEVANASSSAAEHAPIVRMLAVACDGQLRQWRLRLRQDFSAAGGAADAAAGARGATPSTRQFSFAPVAEVADSVMSIIANVDAGLPAEGGVTTGANGGVPAARVTVARVLIAEDGAPTVQLATRHSMIAAPGETSGFGFPRPGSAQRALATVSFYWNVDAACWMRQ